MTKVKELSLYTMAVLYIVAGLLHFLHPLFYLQIVPPQLPGRLAIVYLSGAAEILLGLLLFPQSTRCKSAWGIIALLVTIFPANIYMWLADVHIDGRQLPAWFHFVRLPLQGLLIWWAYGYTKPISETKAVEIRDS